MTAFKVDDKVEIETAGGWCPVKVVEPSGDRHLIVQFAEGEEAVVPLDIVRREGAQQ